MALSYKHVGSKISAKIKIYILCRGKLLYTLCNGILCSSIIILKNNETTKRCYTEVSSFTEGSSINVISRSMNSLSTSNGVNVQFEVHIIEPADSLPNEFDMMADMLGAINSTGMGNFSVDANSLVISK